METSRIRERGRNLFRLVSGYEDLAGNIDNNVG